MSKRGWNKKNQTIEAALAQARKRRMCLAACTRKGTELLGRRVSEGTLLSPFPHLFEQPDYWASLSVSEKAIRVIRGTATLHPDWTFCDVSAALAYGLEVSQPKPGVVHIATSLRAHTASTSHVIRHALAGPGVVTARGVRVVDLDTCLKGCLCTLDLPHGLAVADSYLRNMQVDPEDLVMLTDDIRQNARHHHALRTALLADPRAENGGESMARGTMIELGFEVPELQVDFGNPLDPGQHFRVDFYWEGSEGRSAVIGELDGMDKYRDPTMLNGRTTVMALADERMRESRLSVSDARIMRFRFADVLDRHGFARLLDTFGVPKEKEDVRDGGLPGV